MCAFGVLGLSCEAPAAPKPPGFTPPKFNEQTPREREKERNGGGRGKKRAKFWAVRRRGVQWRGGPAEGGPGRPPLTRLRVWVFGELGTTTQQQQQKQQHQNNNTRKFGQNTETRKLAKVGLAKVGQHSKTLKLAKVGLAKVGHDQPDAAANFPRK